MGDPEDGTADVPSARVFLSYRREDSSGYAGRLFDALVVRFGAGSVFMDIDTIAPGQDFVQVIESALLDCEIVLVLIGPNWLNVRDKRKRRRLDNPDDFVRLEIEGALSRQLHVLPVLVGGAEIPSSRELPSSLAALARRHAFDLSDRRWHYDVQTLLSALQAQSKALAHPAGSPVEVHPPHERADDVVPAQADETAGGTPAPAPDGAAEGAEAQSPESIRSADQTGTPVDEPTPSLSWVRRRSTDARVWGATAVAALLVVGAVILALRLAPSVTHASTGNPLNGVSCTGASLCVAVDQSGNVLTSTNVGQAASWSVANVDGSNDLYDVSCPSASLCAAVDYNGNVITSANPTGGSTAWLVTHVDGANALSGVSCPSAVLCVAVDQKGNVITSSNPTGGAKAWSVAHVDGSNALFGVSCPSASRCVAVDQKGNVITSANPLGGAKAWSLNHVDGSHELDSVSCLSAGGNTVSQTSAGLCVASDYNGNVITSADPAGGAWSVTNVDGTNALDGVSCPSPGLCVAVDQKGNVITSLSPTGGAAAWSVTNVDGYNWLGDVSCASVIRCVAVDQKGNVIISADPTRGVAAWSVIHANALASQPASPDAAPVSASPHT